MGKAGSSGRIDDMTVSVQKDHSAPTWFGPTLWHTMMSKVFMVTMTETERTLAGTAVTDLILDLFPAQQPHTRRRKQAGRRPWLDQRIRSACTGYRLFCAFSI